MADAGAFVFDNRTARWICRARWQSDLWQKLSLQDWTPWNADVDGSRNSNTVASAPANIASTQ
jgi:hypothetical protein